MIGMTEKDIFPSDGKSFTIVLSVVKFTRVPIKVKSAIALIAASLMVVYAFSLILVTYSSSYSTIHNA